MKTCSHPDSLPSDVSPRAVGLGELRFYCGFLNFWLLRPVSLMVLGAQSTLPHAGSAIEVGFEWSSLGKVQISGCEVCSDPVAFSILPKLCVLRGTNSLAILQPRRKPTPIIHHPCFFSNPPAQAATDLFPAYVRVLHIPWKGVLLPRIPCGRLLPPGTMPSRVFHVVRGQDSIPFIGRYFSM